MTMKTEIRNPEPITTGVGFYTQIDNEKNPGYIIFGEATIDGRYLTGTYVAHPHGNMVGKTLIDCDAKEWKRMPAGTEITLTQTN